MAFELFEQLGGLPEMIVYPAGGGTGLIGMWKAFDELEALGWIGPGRPRMVAVQAAGCAPIVRAFHSGADRAQPWDRPHTYAEGLRVPAPLADRLMLRALRQSQGTAVMVSDDQIRAAVRQVAGLEGIALGPEGAATWAAALHLQAARALGSGRLVLFNTGSAYKYPWPSA
jgi:threonine synthase